MTSGSGAAIVSTPPSTSRMTSAVTAGVSSFTSEEEVEEAEEAEDGDDDDARRITLAA